MLACAAVRKFVALIFKFPIPVAEILLFYLIYRLIILEGKDKTEIHMRNQWIMKD